MSDLTNRIHSVVRDIVTDHFEDESPFFDQLWTVFWKRLNCDRIEDLVEAPWWNKRETPTQALGALGDGGGQALDTLYLVASVVGAAIVLLRDEDAEGPDTQRIQEAIRAEASKVEAPQRVRDVLDKYVTGLLAEQFGAMDWRSQVDQDDAGAPLRYCIEWCESDESVSGDLIRSQGTFEVDETRERFQSTSSRFALFIDETQRVIQVRGGINRWKSLQARHRQYLHLILTALKRGGSVRHSQVSRAVGDGDYVDPTKIRRLKSESNEKLGGVIDEILTVQRGLKLYELEPIPYCWIRLDGQESILKVDRR